MAEEKETTIYLNEKFDQLAVNVQCPICGDKYLAHTPYVHVPCKCGATYKTDFRQDIYTKKGKEIISKVSWNDVINFIVSEKYEGELMQLKEHFRMQLCWDLSKITQKMEEHRRCNKCGVCYDCYTCKSCGKTFKPDENRRKQRCPHCKSESFTKTYFKKVLIREENKEIRLCPHCKSDNITMTRTTNKTKCHLCGSEELSNVKSERMFYFTIKRKGAYKTENA